MFSANAYKTKGGHMVHKTDYDFEKIMKNHYNEIFHYVRKQTNNTEDAQDLTQEIFMKVFNNLHTYKSNRASIRTWIYRIAHNHTMNHFKSKPKQYKIDLEDKYLERITQSDDDLLEKLIQSEDIQYILVLMNNNLSKKHLKILNLYFFSELSIAEIAQLLKTPIKTIYNTINVSIIKLRKKMEDQLNE